MNRENRKLEKRLAALAEKLPEAPKMKGALSKKPERASRRVRPLALCAALLVLTLAAAFAFSPGLRGAVIAFFRVEGSVSPGEENITHLFTPAPTQRRQTTQEETAQWIPLKARLPGETGSGETVFFAQYVAAEDFLDANRCFLTLAGEDGEKACYTIENGALLRLSPAWQIRREITVCGIQGRLDYDVYRLGTQIAFQFRGEAWRFMIDGDRDAIFSLSPGPSATEAYLTIYVNPQQEEWTYTVLYDLESGGITDFLAECLPEELLCSPWLGELNLSPDGTRGILLAGESRESAQSYLVDLVNKTCVPLETLEKVRPEGSSPAVWVDEDRLLYATEGWPCSAWVLRLSAGSWRTLFEEAGYLPQGEVCQWYYKGVDRRQGILIDESGQGYLLHYASGERQPVEGITWNENTSALASPGGRWIYLQGAEGWTEDAMAVLDTKTSCTWLFSRELPKGYRQVSACWYDDDILCVQAKKEQTDETLLCLYEMNP